MLTVDVDVDATKEEEEIVAKLKPHLVLVKFNAKSVASQIMKLLTTGTGMNHPPLDLMHVDTML
ncbi:hypothetical protein A2U01_0073172, partial [Trifolium medium]|nr:hypothetical protein [Trifolium medium]